MDHWRASGGGQELLADLLGINDARTIHFAGQSLGGALAQYAAYDFVRARTTVGDAAFDPLFSAARVTLTTFNGLGGIEGLKRLYPSAV